MAYRLAGGGAITESPFYCCYSAGNASNVHLANGHCSNDIQPASMKGEMTEVSV